MVKNTHGGSGHKKFGRKFTTAPKSNKLRVSEDEGEIYAIVTKMLGNNMFHCCCIDGATRLGHIRGKFAGRGKRDNIVQGGKWVLIGLREWDSEAKASSTPVTVKGKVKLQQCDLLEIYSDSDKQRLKDSIDENWSELDKNDVSRDAHNITDDNSGFIFGTDADFEREKLVEEMKSATAEKITMKIGEKEKEKDDEEEINIDDI
jgi:translation initiation factor 1A